MKIPLLYLFLGFAFCSINAAAQQSSYVLPLDESIMLGKEQLNKSSKVLFEVIDLTGDSVLGYLPIEKTNNDRIAIIPPLSKQEWLQSLLAVSLDGVLDRRQLLYIVNDISLGRHSNGNYMRIKASLYESAPEADAYRLLKTIDDLINDNAADIGSINSLVSNALNNSVSALIGTAAGKTMKREEVLSFEKSKSAFISINVFPSGIYMNYDEFKSSKPSFGVFYLRMDTVTKKVEINALNSLNDTAMRPVTPWAIAVANELYIFKNGKLYAAEAIGNNLVISKYVNPHRRLNNAIFWRNNIGRRFDLTKDSNPFDNQYVVMLNDYRKKNITGEAIKINADTGEFEL